MDARTKLLEYIENMSEYSVHKMLEAAEEIIRSESCGIESCPYCGSKEIIRYGKKCGKQRYYCKHCEKTFVTTTHTIMSESHQPAAVWKEVISDTIQGRSIDFTKDRLKLSHACVFDMRHKFLLALEDISAGEPTILSDIVELDETYVLDCQKGRKCDDGSTRPARKHGAKAQKRGLSSEYICICTGIQRGAGIIAEAVNRARPSIKEVQQVYEGHISDGALLLCDGLNAYPSLMKIANCTVKNVNKAPETEKKFFHLNTVNSLHSFIKNRYIFYRGVATKFLNRYNTLFAISFRQNRNLILSLRKKLLHPSSVNYWHSIQNVNFRNLLVL